MRADRLVAALLILQRRGRVTAAELAGELEVSVPTARRDLQAMSAAGIPVYPQPGRGGGWHLVGGARTDLSGLTAGEAQALFALLGPSRRAHPHARSALRKLVRALPSTLRADAEASADAVVVDPTGWGQSRTPRAPHLEALREAVVRRHRLRLRYGSPDGESERLVDPWGLVEKGSRWYLVAGTAHGQRTFRVDRIREFEPSGESFRRPDGLDLHAVWEQIVDTVESRRGQLVVSVELSPGAVGMLRKQFGSQAAVHRDEDGHWSGTVAGRNVDVVARMLAPFAGVLTVLDPPQVRTRLAQLGADLVRDNAG